MFICSFYARKSSTFTLFALFYRACLRNFPLYWEKPCSFLALSDPTFVMKWPNLNRNPTATATPYIFKWAERKNFLIYITLKRVTIRIDVMWEGRSPTGPVLSYRVNLKSICVLLHQSHRSPVLELISFFCYLRAVLLRLRSSYTDFARPIFSLAFLHCYVCAFCFFNQAAVDTLSQSTVISCCRDVNSFKRFTINSLICFWLFMKTGSRCYKI